MTAFIVAACIAVGILGIGGTWLILRREDARPLSVPGRDAPESPATTGPPVAAPPWWPEGEPGIPAGDSKPPPMVHHEEVMPSDATSHALVLMRGLPATQPVTWAGLTLEPGPEIVPPGDTAVPAPASLPEGDKQLLWPQKEAPAREPSPLAKAVAAIRDAPVDDYLGEVEDTTAYGDDGPFVNWLSQETQARGIPAVKP